MCLPSWVPHSSIFQELNKKTSFNTSASTKTVVLNKIINIASLILIKQNIPPQNLSTSFSNPHHADTPQQNHQQTSLLNPYQANSPQQNYRQASLLQSSSSKQSSTTLSTNFAPCAIIHHVSTFLVLGRQLSAGSYTMRSD